MSEQQQPYFIMGENPSLNVSLPAMDGTAYVRVDPQDLEAIRAFVQREVQRALHPEPGLIDVRHFLAVEATDEQGNKWKGLLYAVEQQT